MTTENHPLHSTETLWIWQNDQMIKKPITFVPGLYKIFDEILVNAANNKQRNPKMNSVKVNIDVANNMISVWNNGDGIPVIMRQDDGVYVPELIFGAKLANIFSTEFTIETADGKRKKRSKQVFRDNMRRVCSSIKTCKSSENWTMVSFKPDLAKYGMECLEDDTVALMKRRVIDLAGCLGNCGEVELNGTRLSFKTFEEYVKLYPGTSTKTMRIYEKVNDKWDICVCMSHGEFEQVSFVNNIATMKGGSHVDYITSQITGLLETLVNFEPNNIKSYLWVFVNALIDNPDFDSGTRENLTTDKDRFGSTCKLTHKLLKKIAKPYVANRLLLYADNPDEKLKKTRGKRKGLLNIPTLIDANMVATDKSRDCTLILAQGDSAKAFAMSGLLVVGRDYYGVFPLEGELLDVREASHQKLQENTEIQKIKKILGLQDGKVYEDVEELRYGHLMIMADEDHDSSHIKGLLIYFLHSFWPSLLKVSKFMRVFITPVVMVSNKKTKDVISFYTMHDYEAWKKNLVNKATKYTIKYFKGLRTCEDEGAEYFGFDHHIQDFVWVDNNDDDAIELAFSKMKIEATNDLLRAPQAGTYIVSKEKSIRYCDFINNEFKQYLVAHLRRSIPSVVDGLNPGQRKILFCAFKKPIIQKIKVAQFSHYVSEHSAYHHGEASLVGTIIGMAQNYVGSNNINLLQPIGQFGTRHMGGKEYLNDRCIFTQLSPITRYLFYKADELLFKYLNDDGQSIEPSRLMPIIPMVLVNGSEGTGLGCSSFIPNYNPRDIIANLKRKLCGEAMVPMDPWYKGFIGKIVTASKDTGYTTIGKVEELKDRKGLRITELPVGRWTWEYEEFLKAASQYKKGKAPFIEDYTAHNDKTIVDFTINMSKDQMNTAKQEGFVTKFKLTTTLSTANMYLFDAHGAIKKYDTPEQILEDFFYLFLAFYEERTIALRGELTKAILLLENKVKFIGEVREGNIRLFNREDADICAELKAKGFAYLPKETKPTTAGAVDHVGREEYDYLLSMSFATFSKFEQLKKEMDAKKQELEMITKSTYESLWVRDLEALDQQLEEQYPLEEHMAKINLKSSQDDDESSPEIAEEAPKNKAPAKRTAAGPQRASKKKQRCD